MPSALFWPFWASRENGHEHTKEEDEGSEKKGFGVREVRERGGGWGKIFPCFHPVYRFVVRFVVRDSPKGWSTRCLYM